MSYYRSPEAEILQRRLERADQPGRHLWVMSVAFQVSDPLEITRTGDTPMLDNENLVMLAGPGCFKCEQPWTPAVERRRCRGRLP